MSSNVAAAVTVLVVRFGSQLYTEMATVSPPVTTNDTAELLQYALPCVERLYQPEIAFKKAGVLLLHLVPAGQTQMSVLDERDRERSKKLMGVMDQLNRQFGAGTLRFAAAGMHQHWQLKAAHRSRSLHHPLAGAYKYCAVRLKEHSCYWFLSALLPLKSPSRSFSKSL